MWLQQEEASNVHLGDWFDPGLNAMQVHDEFVSRIKRLRGLEQYEIGIPNL